MVLLSLCAVYSQRLGPLILAPISAAAVKIVALFAFTFKARPYDAQIKRVP
jgi:hypothetical protein